MSRVFSHDKLLTADLIVDAIYESSTDGQLLWSVSRRFWLMNLKFEDPNVRANKK